jgi:preprotein translocase subunit SecE
MKVLFPLLAQATPEETGPNWVLIACIAVVVLLGWALRSKIRIFFKKYLPEVKTELQKATWPWVPKDKGEKGFKRFKELTDSTVVVFIAMMLLGAFVSLWDLILFNIIELFTKIG